MYRMVRVNLGLFSLSKNSFSHNPVACTTLVNALDAAHKLFHICVDIQESKPKDL